jgi:exonuclease VII small subunit
LIANFDDKGHITEMESIGADLDTAQEAWERPVDYFDTCYECGSDNIVW